MPTPSIRRLVPVPDVFGEEAGALQAFQDGTEGAVIAGDVAEAGYQCFALGFVQHQVGEAAGGARVEEQQAALVELPEKPAVVVKAAALRCGKRIGVLE